MKRAMTDPGYVGPAAGFCLADFDAGAGYIGKGGKKIADINPDIGPGFKPGRSDLYEMADANVQEFARSTGFDTRMGSERLHDFLGHGEGCFRRDIFDKMQPEALDSMNSKPLIGPPNICRPSGVPHTGLNHSNAPENQVNLISRT